MDICEHYYYRTNTKLFKVLGAWFCQGTRTKLICTTVVTVTMFICFVTQTLLLYKSRWAIKTTLEVLPQLTAIAVIVIKYITCRCNPKMVEDLYSRISANWKLCYTQSEIEIMSEYAKKGRLFTVYYMVILYAATLLFISVPAIPRLLDALAPLNESRPNIYTYPCYYIIDMDKYYLYILFHMTYTTYIAMTALLCADTLFMMVIQHGCSLFAIVRYRLQRLYPDEDGIRSMRQPMFDQICRRNMVRAIRSHQRAIEFAGVIETSFSTSLFVQLGFWVLCLTCILMQVMLSLNTDAVQLVKYLTYLTGQMFHILAACYPGQELTNHSKQVGFNAIGAEWYKLPTQTQRMMLLVLRRSLEPSYITARNVFIFNLESFMTVVQSSISYVTVLLSVN